MQQCKSSWIRGKMHKNVQKMWLKHKCLDIQEWFPYMIVGVKNFSLYDYTVLCEIIADMSSDIVISATTSEQVERTNCIVNWDSL